MDDFIEAMQIFRKYGNPKYPFYCEHDILHVHVVKPVDVSEEDRIRLDELGFIPEGVEKDEDGNIINLESVDHWYSRRCLLSKTY